VKSQRKSRLVSAAALAVVGALTLAACGGSSDSSDSSAETAEETTEEAPEETAEEAPEETSEEEAPAEEYTPESGVPVGASMEEYQQALADMEPVTLLAQSPSPQGAGTGRRFEEYGAAVEEWSGGKITFEWAYANAVAPPLEIDDALQDGRLDIASTLPTYEPDQYPATNELIAASFRSVSAPIVGSMQSLAWMVEVANQTPEIAQEFADNGMVLLSPIFNSGASVMMCKDSRTTLDEMKGAQISVSSSGQGVEVEALGMTPTSVPYTELFEALERGVVDCSGASLLVAQLIGFSEAAPNVTQDQVVGFTIGTGSWAMSQEKWDALPLTAQQLMYDKMDVFYEVNVDSSLDAAAAGTTAIIDAGGGIKPYSDDALAALSEANDGLLEGLRGSTSVDGDAFVENVIASSDRWLQIVTDLGYADPGDLNELPEFLEASPVDPGPWMDVFFEEVLLDQRPS